MDIEVRPIMQSELRAAADVAARSLFHLFTHVGEDPVEQLVAAYAAYRTIPWEGQRTVAAFAEGDIVAMAKTTEPGNCWCDRIDEAPEPTDENEAGVLAYRRFLDEYHPDVPHWWFGPVGVEPGMQRRGLGTLVMQAALEDIVQGGAGEVWLESEPHIAGFYRRLGFTDMAEAADPDGITLIFQRLIV